jgi:non-canonical poly(A) RNA polymerase PAPD5/7
VLRLHREVDAFIKYISPTPAEDEVRGLIIQLITRAVGQNFPDAEVLPFGSYQTKLYLPLGDIDLVIQSPSMAYSDKVTVLHALANTMRRAGITDRVTIVAKAKVPIIKFVTIHGRFSVDISLNQVNGVAAGKMISRYLRELPALRGLVMVTKAFLSQRSMNEVYTGGLGSYSIVCLAISFLQMHPKIRRGEIDPSQNLGVLVIEFFELYGCYFNYEEVGISLRDGGTYFNKAMRGWQDYKQIGLLSIEDPSDPSAHILSHPDNVC